MSQRTTATGQGGWCTSARLVEPSRRPRNAPRPLEPTTSSSAEPARGEQYVGARSRGRVYAVDGRVRMPLPVAGHRLGEQRGTLLFEPFEVVDGRAADRPGRCSPGRARPSPRSVSPDWPPLERRRTRSLPTELLDPSIPTTTPAVAWSGPAAAVRRRPDRSRASRRGPTPIPWPGRGTRPARGSRARPGRHCLPPATKLVRRRRR